MSGRISKKLIGHSFPTLQGAESSGVSTTPRLKRHLDAGACIPGAGSSNAPKIQQIDISRLRQAPTCKRMSPERSAVTARRARFPTPDRAWISMVSRPQKELQLQWKGYIIRYSGGGNSAGLNVTRGDRGQIAGARIEPCCKAIFLHRDEARAVKG